MTDPKGQQTGARGPGSPEAQIAIPQIVIQPANNSDEISPIARDLAQRGRIPPSDGNFLEVPTSSRPSNRPSSSHRCSSSKSRRPFVEAFHVPIDPLRMHPTGLTSSTTMPATAATGNPSGLRFDGNPFTPHGREVMAKVEKMLAANKELKPEPEGFKFAHLLERSFYRKLKSPIRLFSKSKPKQPIQPHQIRHVIPCVPSPRLRQNERINVQKREKALQVLGETPQFDTLLSSDPAQSPSSSAEDPFAESSSRGATRAPTEFETRLRATKSAGALLSRPTADPFQTERVMASNHDSLLPDAPAAASTPPRAPTSPLPPNSLAAAGAGVAAQESPTRAPGTTTTAAAAAATTTTTTTSPATSSAPALRPSRSTSHPDAAPGARPEPRHARPCADAGSAQSAGGCTSAADNTTTPAANTTNADGGVAVAGAAVVAADEAGSGAAAVAAVAVEGVAGVVPRVALSLRRVSSGRRRGWVWAGDGEEEGEQERRRRRLPGPLRGVRRRVPRRGGRSRLFGTGPPPRWRKMVKGGGVARGGRGR
ncbi:hypothetical protein F5144DRAFT_616915 [Chaetomium tenue]|uniref:Uncharacterized protein n=1 Tax=Chaetomium tenue TaxID=1854479 RepID=A0ACB7PM63_9PEZI|nr:hypothetical protein F5144DRAFT_616915 [Chaetomium globosum]